MNNKIDEGYTFEFTPVLSIDGKTVEATMRCDIDQVEKMHSVPLDLPNVNGARVNLEVPQLSAQRLQERFRWPSNQILIIGLGMIPPRHQLTAQVAFYRWSVQHRRVLICCCLSNQEAKSMRILRFNGLFLRLCDNAQKPQRTSSFRTFYR